MSSPEVNEIIRHFAEMTRGGKLRPAAEADLKLEAERLLMKYSPHEIKARIDKTKGKKAMVLNLTSLFPEMEEGHASAHIPAEANLIVTGEFYYHYELQEVPPVPKAGIDHNGNVTQEFVPFHLHVRDKYTLGDLYRYFLEQCGIEDKHKQKTIRSLEELVYRYGLDLILFAIDEASDRYKDSDVRRVRNPWDLDRYFDDAEERLDVAIGNAKFHKTHKPIPKWKAEELYDYVSD